MLSSIEVYTIMTCFSHNLFTFALIYWFDQQLRIFNFSNQNDVLINGMFLVARNYKALPGILENGSHSCRGMLI